MKGDEIWTQPSSNKIPWTRHYRTSVIPRSHAVFAQWCSMEIARKTPDGCWTCRLRRKKCDRRRPICSICKNLEIDCHFDSQKPEWMDGARMQRDKAKHIKYQIKQHAASRRERSHASLKASIAVNPCGNSVIDFAERSMDTVSLSTCDIRSHEDLNVQERSMSSGRGRTHELTDSLLPNSSSASLKLETTPVESERALGVLDHLMDNHDCSAFFSQHQDYETDFIMKYLDYVFPSLFPFYRPAIFETGRSWLLSLLKRSKIVFHSALSLTSYFFTVALTDSYDDAYSDCTDEIWGRLEDQTNKCFEMVHTNMADLNLQDKTITALEKVHIMESIVQLLLFEVVLGRLVDWNMHLTPALMLFEDVMGGVNSHDSKMVSVLHSIGKPSWFKAEFGHYMWNPDQAGFRFFSALLIFIDIIGSTALAQPPKLAAHHLELLEEQDDGSPVLGFTQLRLSTVVGCQNSIIVSIGQIATLDSWKRDMKRTGTLVIAELIERSKSISATLQSQVDALELSAAIPRPLDPLNLPFLSYAVRANASSSSMLMTRIWAHAAQLYLFVVVHGWQPSHFEVYNRVSRVLELLSTVPSNHIRTLAWPLCVAGCLACTEHEQAFRDVFAARKKLEIVGSLGDAQRVMEKVWERRESNDPDTWDIAACLNIWEKPVLLI